MKRVVLAAAALAASLAAHAQLTSVDGGLAMQDTHGMMFANVIDNVAESPGDDLTQLAWVAQLNSEKYGGFSDWTLATANATSAPNNSTNQLSELFQVDCVSNGCASFSALSSAMQTMSWTGQGWFMSSSLYAGQPPGCGTPNSIECLTSKTYYLYQVPGSGVGGKSGPVPFDTIYPFEDAIAVRNVTPAPELNAGSGLAAVTVLCGAVLVLKSLRRRSM